VVSSGFHRNVKREDATPEGPKRQDPGTTGSRPTGSPSRRPRQNPRQTLSDQDLTPCSCAPMLLTPADPRGSDMTNVFTYRLGTGNIEVELLQLKGNVYHKAFYELTSLLVHAVDRIPWPREGWFIRAH